MSTTLSKLKSLYKRGENISAYLRAERNVPANTREIIEIAYDLQSGSYVEAMRDPKMSEHKNAYAKMIAERIRGLMTPRTVMEAGVGEATTFSSVLSAVAHGQSERPVGYGFDLSWSRIAVARQWLTEHGIKDARLCTGDLMQMPFAENSIDVVYTSHSIEPNGGREREILQQLHRVTKHYLVLLEPGYELAGDEAKARMESHGYCRDLPGHCESLGYKVLTHELFPLTANPLNPTALTIIEKRSPAHESHAEQEAYACPETGGRLISNGSVMFSPEGLLAYPIIEGIACLRKENAVMASQFEEQVLRRGAA
ncbi:methyltransferase domain-containing protein [Crateriforma spongiae]|uniref:methyltransferase domain-containing protein n=1 Tax=Crateriforma spongiae TaxID=2724528 RepID=UPI0039B03393